MPRPGDADTVRPTNRPSSIGNRCRPAGLLTGAPNARAEEVHRRESADELVGLFLEHGMKELADFARRNPSWFFEWVDTHGASKITGVPVATLETLRSRGGGPLYNTPKGSRSVLYMRIELYKWTLAGGLHRNTGD
jgi:hypothetical protein